MDEFCIVAETKAKVKITFLFDNHYHFEVIERTGIVLKSDWLQSQILNFFVPEHDQSQNFFVPYRDQFPNFFASITPKFDFDLSGVIDCNLKVGYDFDYDYTDEIEMEIHSKIYRGDFIDSSPQLLEELLGLARKNCNLTAENEELKKSLETLRAETEELRAYKAHHKSHYSDIDPDQSYRFH